MPHVHHLSQIKRSLEGATQVLRCTDIGKQQLKLTGISQTCRTLSTVSVVQLPIPSQSLRCKHQTMAVCACSILTALSRHQTCSYSALSSPKPGRRLRSCDNRCSLLVKLYQSPPPIKQHTNGAVLAVQDLVFGASFTDHMFLVEHIDGKGWGQPVIRPFGNISMHPAAQALHYGVCCFEGMKGYLGKDGKARLFRYDCNL